MIELQFSPVKCQITYDYETINGTQCLMYGISFISDSETIRYPSLSSDREIVSKLINNINKEKVPPMHVEYIIEDFLHDNYGKTLPSYKK